MATDRELLEAAARAAGVDAWWSEIHSTMFLADRYDSGTEYQQDAVWNPLADDGDALRLAVKLGIDVQQFVQTGMVEAWKHPHQAQGEDYGSDPYAATRRAIVRAAASLQESRDD